MAESAGQLLYEFSEALVGQDGTLYLVRVFGRARSDGTWEAWLEFSAPGGRTYRTPRETTQSTADGVRYWASGLQPTYLEGALARALR